MAKKLRLVTFATPLQKWRSYRRRNKKSGNFHGLHPQKLTNGYPKWWGGKRWLRLQIWSHCWYLFNSSNFSGAYSFLAMIFQVIWSLQGTESVIQIYPQDIRLSRIDVDSPVCRLICRSSTTPLVRSMLVMDIYWSATSLSRCGEHPYRRKRSHKSSIWKALGITFQGTVELLHLWRHLCNQARHRPKLDDTAMSLQVLTFLPPWKRSQSGEKSGASISEKKQLPSWKLRKSKTPRPFFEDVF